MKWELKKYDIKYLTKKSSEFSKSKLITRLLLRGRRMCASPAAPQGGPPLPLGP